MRRSKRFVYVLLALVKLLVPSVRVDSSNLAHDRLHWNDTQTGLPSAAELFASGGSSAPGVAAFQSTSYDTSAPKRSLPHDQALSTAAATAAKRFKPDAQASAPGPPRSVKKATHFAPPQLKRPNVSTEDLGYVRAYVRVGGDSKGRQTD